MKSDNKQIYRPRPFLKWAGGKSRVAKSICEYFPADYKCYYEPFLGGGAMYFTISPKKGRLNDLNQALVSTYMTVKNDCESLIKKLEKIQREYYALPSIEDKEHYYYDARSKYNKIKDPSINKSALFIFLNKTGFNGMYRENSKREYNIPFGKHNTPPICDANNLRNVSRDLRSIEITCDTYENALIGTKAGDLIYLDPPYAPISETSSFTQYQAGGFLKEDQLKLHDLFDKLSKKGCKVVMSNSNAPLIKELYKKHYISTIEVGRTINSKKNLRGKVKEVVITNFELKNDLGNIHV
jgi:DNA adenine methylase